MLKKLSSAQKEQIEATLKSLSLEEKIGQLVCERYINIRKNDQDVSAWLKKYPVGSIYVGSEGIDTYNMDSEQIKEQVARVQNATRVPPVLVSDFEQGVGGQLDDNAFTQFPEAMALAASGNPRNAYEAGRITALEAGTLNVHWTLGTVADLAINRDNPITGIRAFGSDPDKIIPYVNAHIQGLQEHNCAACAKHFPGDGLDTRNQHFVTSFNPLNKAEWLHSYGKVWKAVIDAGVMSIMVGHIAMPELEAMDPVSQKYRPATASKLIMSDLLRGELGFEGLIITDALCMIGFCSWADYESRMLDAFNAGADVFEWPETERFFACMLSAAQDGRLCRQRLDDAVRHVLQFKARLDLRPRAFADPEAGKIADRMAAEALTLLRNVGGALPLPAVKGGKYYVLATPSHPQVLKIVQPFMEELSRQGEARLALLNAMDPGEFAEAEAVILLNLGRSRYGDYRGMHSNIWPLMGSEEIKRRVVIGMANPFFLYDVPSCDAYIAAWSAHPAAQRQAVQVLFGQAQCTGQSPVEIYGLV